MEFANVVSKEKALDHLEQYGGKISIVGMPVNQFIQKDGNGNVNVYSHKNGNFFQQPTNEIILNLDAVLDLKFFIVG
jgi:hypothetical protein